MKWCQFWSLHKYVPFNEETNMYSPLLMGGDQLTTVSWSPIVRATTARKVRVTNQGKNGLQGLVPFCADWHAKVNFMQIRFVYVTVTNYFSMSSLTDKPHSNVFPTNYISLPLAKRKTIFLDHLLAITDRYVIPRNFHTEKLQESLQPQPEEVRQNPHLHSGISLYAKLQSLSWQVTMFLYCVISWWVL